LQERIEKELKVSPLILFTKAHVTETVIDLLDSITSFLCRNLRFLVGKSPPNDIHKRKRATTPWR